MKVLIPSVTYSARVYRAKIMREFYREIHSRPETTTYDNMQRKASECLNRTDPDGSKLAKLLRASSETF